MKWQDFFTQYGGETLNTFEGGALTIDELYVAIRDRLMAEALVDVPNTSNYGRLAMPTAPKGAST